MTPTDRLSGFGTGLATKSDSGERVPRGHCSQYSTPNGSAGASFFRSLATQKVRGWRIPGVLRPPSRLSEEVIGAGAPALPDDACGRGLVDGTYQELARPARRATRAPEGFQVVRENGPHDSHLDSVQSLPQQHPAYVGLRCVELGGSLGNG